MSKWCQSDVKVTLKWRWSYFCILNKDYCDVVITNFMFYLGIYIVSSTNQNSMCKIEVSIPAWNSKKIIILKRDSKYVQRYKLFLAINCFGELRLLNCRQNCNVFIHLMKFSNFNKTSNNSFSIFSILLVFLGNRNYM